MSQLKTNAPVTWCPGCGNFEILNSMEAVLEELKSEGFPLEKVVILSGIGNHAKIVDYLHVNSFYSIHGRSIPVAEAIKLADKDVKVICFVGDGDTLAEGLEHLIFAAKRNIDITVVLHDNRTYALATGQFTPTSQQDFKGSTMPYGAKEDPFNPLELMLVSGATFIARCYPVKKEHFRKLLKEAIMHKGFSFVDVLQVCISFNNLYADYNKNVKEVETANTADIDEARSIIRSWDYRSSAGPIPIGKFYKTDRPTFEDNFLKFKDQKVDRGEKFKAILESFI
jgi:2-oxoglutarate ferredoxin oxidoreductase subunit beta